MRILFGLICLLCMMDNAAAASATALASAPAGAMGNPFEPTRVIASGAADTATLNDRNLYWNSATASAKAQAVPGCTAAINGKLYDVKDYAGTSATYAVTITPSSGTINKSANYAVATAGANISLKCVGALTDWVIQ